MVNTRSSRLRGSSRGPSKSMINVDVGSKLGSRSNGGNKSKSNSEDETLIGKKLELPFGSPLDLPKGGGDGDNDDININDIPNYILLLTLYTLQGIPMGLSAR